MPAGNRYGIRGGKIIRPEQCSVVGHTHHLSLIHDPSIHRQRSRAFGDERPR